MGLAVGDTHANFGRQWAAVAWIVQGHQLVTEGPYSFVRNPIHLAMFGMLAGDPVGLEPVVGNPGRRQSVSRRE